MARRLEKGGDFIADIGIILEAYSLVLASAITFFLFAIGRFYQLNVGRETHYNWFLVPVILFLSSAVLCVLGYEGVVLADIGAILLSILTIILYNLMMGVEK
ncbi:MAG: hypothetical protein C5S48_03830 [Candidatus Methanogaster sp.]|nr:MAG: hypothetical protein C5S48_03830 [ANME-2 cluster archaeon]